MSLMRLDDIGDEYPNCIVVLGSIWFAEGMFLHSEMGAASSKVK